jgi:hypothetical protein
LSRAQKRFVEPIQQINPTGKSERPSSPSAENIPFDDGDIPLICPTCQNVFRAQGIHAGGSPFFAWGCFRYFG